MTETGTPDEPAEQEQAESSSPLAGERQPRHRRGILALVALIVAIVALCASAALWLYGDRQLQHVNGRLSTLNHSRSDQSDALQNVRSRLNQLGGLQAQLDRLQSLARAQHDNTRQLNKLASQTDQFQQALAKTRKDMGNLEQRLHTDTNGWGLVTVEHLLVAANSQLQLHRDVHGALTALRLAQQQLAQMQDPALFNVRRSVQQEITGLRGVSSVDIEGKVLTLSALIQQVPQLALKRSVPAAFNARGGGDRSHSATGWLSHTWHSVRTALRGMFAIRRTDSRSRALLAPKHEYFLYQNLQLKLEAARLALLRGDASVLHASVATALDWLQKYFKSDAAAVASARQQLRSLATAKLSPQLPDISDSLTQVRKRLIALRETNAERSNDGNPAGEQKPATGHAPASGQQKTESGSAGEQKQPAASGAGKGNDGAPAAGEQKPPTQPAPPAAGEQKAGSGNAGEQKQPAASSAGKSNNGASAGGQKPATRHAPAAGEQKAGSGNAGEQKPSAASGANKQQQQPGSQGSEQSAPGAGGNNPPSADQASAGGQQSQSDQPANKGAEDENQAKGSANGEPNNDAAQAQAPHSGSDSSDNGQSSGDKP